MCLLNNRNSDCTCCLMIDLRQKWSTRWMCEVVGFFLAKPSGVASSFFVTMISWPLPQAVPLKRLTWKSYVTYSSNQSPLSYWCQRSSSTACLCRNSLLWHTRTAHSLTPHSCRWRMSELYKWKEKHKACHRSSLHILEMKKNESSVKKQGKSNWKDCIQGQACSLYETLTYQSQVFFNFT